jgi:hypothetical protein
MEKMQNQRCDRRNDARDRVPVIPSELHIEAVICGAPIGTPNVLLPARYQTRPPNEQGNILGPDGRVYGFAVPRGW